MTTDLGKLTTAAAKWSSMAESFRKLADRYRRDVHGISLGPSWVGLSAQAANSRFDVTLKEFQGAQAEAKAIATALTDAHTQLVGIQKRLKAARADAIRAGMSVSEQGHVSYDYERLGQSERSTIQHDPDLQEGVRKAIASWTAHITQAVQAATDADDGIRIALDSLTRDTNFLDGTVNGFNRNPSPSGYPSFEEAGKAEQIPKDRAKILEWWKSLAPATRAVLLQEKGDELKRSGILDPAYKWKPADEGAGEFNSEDPTPSDLGYLALAQSISAAGDITGETAASRNMEHYLRATGDPLEVDVDKMLNDNPEYRSNAVQTHITSQQEEWKKQALDEYRKAGGDRPVVIPVESEKFGNNELNSGEWFHAIGSHQQNVSGMVTVTPDGNREPKVSLDYQVNIWDRYNWDEGKQTEFPGGITIEDKEMARLHKVGFAQEFDMRGSSSVFHHDLGGDTSPQIPSGESGREGTRGDVSRGDEENR
ncbi:WXG100 family type VII secretion target [Streptomyces sp. NPDC021093]|uniref:WXG100 family type VII secretion target n=1 Tax=Streptomyces sp. NPDC021093 TaxID=3365112 RepID=UPI0037955F3E